MNKYTSHSLRTALICPIMQCVVLIYCRRFGTTNRSNRQGLRQLRGGRLKWLLQSTTFTACTATVNVGTHIQL